MKPLLFLFLLSLLSFGGWQLLFSPIHEEVVLSPFSPTPTEDPFPTASAAVLAVTDGPAEGPTPTIGPIDPATKLDRRELLITVQNGSGEFGAGSKMAEILRDFGYHVIAVGSAPHFLYEGVTITIKEDKKKYLPLLQKDLQVSYEISSASATLTASESADAVVIVGSS